MKVSIWFAVVANLVGLIVGFFGICAAIAAWPECYHDMCDRLIRERQGDYIDYAKARSEE